MDFTQQSYNKIAVDWHRDHSTDDWWVEGIEHLVFLLPIGASVLDVGCGAEQKQNF